MKIKIILTAILGVAWCLPATPALAGAQKKTEQAVSKAQTLCPVNGGPIDRKVHADYKGKRIYFCCASCIDTFKKDPEKVMTQMKKQGIELENAPEAASHT